MENLNELIEQFEKVRPQVEKERALLYKERTDFVSYFDENKLASMTLDEYCGGKGADFQNFSYGLWNTLRDLSLDLTKESSQANKCSVCGVSYFNDTYKFEQKWQNEEDEPFDAIKTALIELYNAGKSNNYDAIRGNKLHSWLKAKFLSTFFPDRYLCFCNKQILKRYVQRLGGSIVGKQSDDVLSLQKILLELKEKRLLLKDWTVDIFAYFLWNYVKDNIEISLKKSETMESSLVTTYKKFLLKNHNMIFTGAPGTGKTYLAKQIAASIIGCDVKELKGNKQFGFVQFHPSYDYTDFVEGLRPSDKEGKEFEYRQGIFKAFCASALKTRKEYMEEYKDEDPDGKNAPKFILIIDEINRGEISKIFGELFFSIDPGYRGDTGIVKTQYQNMVTDGPFMDGFYVPDNVYIIGTMNDIDRSVETLDFAFRRRFPSIEIKYADTLESMADQFPDNANRDEAKQHLYDLNAAIIKDENLGSEYCIGGAYLLKLKDVDGSYTDLWKYYIEPVIAEYFRGLPSQERIDNIAKLRDAFIPKKNEDDK